MNIIPFRFQGIRLKEACWIDKAPYFTRRAIGEFLEYSKPQEAVDKIVNRNSYIRQFGTTIRMMVIDEYPKGHSHPKMGCKSLQDSPLNLRGESTQRLREIETEVYNPIGLQLIIMESRQPKALQFKVAAAHLVWAYMNGQLRIIPPDPDLETLSELPYFLHGKSKAIKEYAIKQGIAPITVRRQIRRILRDEPITGKNGNKDMQFIQKKHAQKFQAVVHLYKQGFRMLHIARKLGMCHATVYRWIRKYEHGFCPQADHAFDSNKVSGGIQ